MTPDATNPPDGLSVHHTAFARLGVPAMTDHLREDHRWTGEQADRATLLGEHWTVHADSAAYDEARATFVDDITMPLVKAVAAGIRPEDMRADFEALLSIHEAQAGCCPRPPQAGDRVRLIRHADPWSRLQPGTLGRVTLIDSTGTVHVRWDDGSTLGLVEDAGDRWEVIPA